ncbi:MAG: hypothetical protein WCG99_00865 [Candidatus Berkelbacteria bacterium]
MEQTTTTKDDVTPVAIFLGTTFFVLSLAFLAIVYLIYVAAK